MHQCRERHSFALRVLAPKARDGHGRINRPPEVGAEPDFAIRHGFAPVDADIALHRRDTDLRALQIFVRLARRADDARQHLVYPRGFFVAPAPRRHRRRAGMRVRHANRHIFGGNASLFEDSMPNRFHIGLFDGNPIERN